MNILASVCRIGALIIIICSLSGLSIADYLFEVNHNESVVQINTDGSATIEYALTFTCLSGGKPIDIVDVGLPNRHYDLSTAEASIDNIPLPTVRKSEYISIGVEIPLGAHTIQPFQQKTLRLKILQDHMVYPDSVDATYASLEFAPTWYGSQYAKGTTQLDVYIVFPANMTESEPKYHHTEFTEAYFNNDGRIVYHWQRLNFPPDKSELFGASFPRSYVTKVYEPVAKESSPTSPFLVNLFAWLIGLSPILLPILAIIFRVSKKKKYMPPSLTMGGVGIKRGLTAVEAALVMEIPLERVLTMILFGLMRKNAISTISTKPLRIAKLENIDETKLLPYEKDILGIILPDGKLDHLAFSRILIEAIREVNKKLRGFSRRETKEYYQDIVRRAWDMVAAAKTPEVQAATLDEELDWIMADKKFESKSQEVFGSQPTYYMPQWMSRHYYGPATTAGQATAASSASRTGSTQHVPTYAKSGPQLPSLPGADFANSFVNSVTGMASSIVADSPGLTSKVIATTNPVVVHSSSGKSSSGRSCACACACAGCACACAGGGR